jgi:hypothetical protein
VAEGGGGAAAEGIAVAENEGRCKGIFFRLGYFGPRFLALYPHMETK